MGQCAGNGEPLFSVAASGKDVIVTLPQSDLTPGSWTNSMPIVTGYRSSSNHCKVVGWNVTDGSTSTTVRCFDNAGTQLNASITQFDFSYTNRYLPLCDAGFPGASQTGQ